MIRSRFSLLAAILVFALSLTACGADTPAPAAAPPIVSTEEPTVASSPTAAAPTLPQPTATPSPPAATPLLPSPMPPTATPELALAALPPEPQEIVFQAEDGETLVGHYYPGATNPAPLAVLMHWAPGDAQEWEAIAPWLQNRGLAETAPAEAAKPWLDAAWFPKLPEGHSYAVFTFTFRGCEGGCRTFARAEWLLDAQAAMRAARDLEGIDPQRIAAVGASIGADGAADGCAWLNAQGAGACLGAFSLSPGDYLTVPYAQAVTDLGAGQSPKPAWCLYAVEDKASADACKGIREANYRAVEYTGKAHGMQLIAPDLQPSALSLLIEFLEGVIQ